MEADGVPPGAAEPVLLGILSASQALSSETTIARLHARLVAEHRQIAGEQAALRRVAMLVAQGAPPEEVFAAVASSLGTFRADRPGTPVHARPSRTGGEAGSPADMVGAAPGSYAAHEFRYGYLEGWNHGAFPEDTAGCAREQEAEPGRAPGRGADRAGRGLADADRAADSRPRERSAP